jgi:hypothetical protein
MPNRSLKARKMRYTTKNTINIVLPAIRSSKVQDGSAYQDDLVTPAPNVERPRARRKTWSICARAAVVAGEEVGSDVKEVEKDGIGGGIYVAMNM